jgi:hypothetical protein
VLSTSGTRGELTIDVIDENWIQGRLTGLDAGSDPALALPGGTVEFRALRCPGDWRLSEEDAGS